MVLVPSTIHNGRYDYTYGYIPLSADAQRDVMHGDRLPEKKWGNAGALKYIYERQLRPSLGSDWQTPSLTKYGFIMNDGQHAFFDTQTCYGNMGKYYNLIKKINKSGFRYFIDWTASYRVLYHAWSHRGPVKPWDIKYVDWVLNRSPWADIFIYKNAKQVIKQGNLIDMTKWPCKWVIGGTASVRHISEYPMFSNMWDLLRQHMPEIEAYFFSHLIHRLSTDPHNENYNLFFFTTTEGHTPIMAHTFRVEGVVNMFNSYPRYFYEDNTDPMFDKSPRYTGRDKYWYNGGPAGGLGWHGPVGIKKIIGKPAVPRNNDWRYGVYEDGYTLEQILEACKWYRGEVFRKWNEFQQKEQAA